MTSDNEQGLRIATNLLNMLRNGGDVRPTHLMAALTIVLSCHAAANEAPMEKPTEVE